MEEEGDTSQIIDVVGGTTQDSSVSQEVIVVDVSGGGGGDSQTLSDVLGDGGGDSPELDDSVMVIPGSPPKSHQHDISVINISSDESKVGFLFKGFSTEQVFCLHLLPKV